jgi:hypothetical protein
MDFIGDDDDNSAIDIVEFVREVVQTYPNTRDPVLGKVGTFPISYLLLS